MSVDSVVAAASPKVIVVAAIPVVHAATATVDDSPNCNIWSVT